MNWNELADRYLEQNADTPGPVRQVLEQLRETGPAEISRALDPEIAESLKPSSTHLLLHIIGEALQDHVLTESEVRELRVLQRVFRVQEGDLVRQHGQVVSDLLCREAELIFEDYGISPTEAVHKAKLQEVFGLGYDEFIKVLEPEIDRLMNDMFARLENRSAEAWLGTDWQEVRDRLAALSLVRHVQAARQPDPTRAGYIYLLINPSMPGMVKVGRTNHPPAKRAAELTGATGVPTPFTVVFDLFVPDQFAAEEYVHRLLTEKGARVSGNREFFAVEPTEAVQAMLEAREKAY